MLTNLLNLVNPKVFYISVKNKTFFQDVIDYKRYVVRNQFYIINFQGSEHNLYRETWESKLLAPSTKWGPVTKHLFVFFVLLTKDVIKY